MKQTNSLTSYDHFQIDTLRSTKQQSKKKVLLCFLQHSWKFVRHQQKTRETSAPLSDDVGKYRKNYPPGNEHIPPGEKDKNAFKGASFKGDMPGTLNTHF